MSPSRQNTYRLPNCCCCRRRHRHHQRAPLLLLLMPLQRYRNEMALRLQLGKVRWNRMLICGSKTSYHNESPLTHRGVSRSKLVGDRAFFVSNGTYNTCYVDIQYTSRTTNAIGSRLRELDGKSRTPLGSSLPSLGESLVVRQALIQSAVCIFRLNFRFDAG